MENQIPGVLKSFRGFFLQAVADGALERRSRGDRRKVRRVVMQDRVHGVGGGAPPERRESGQHLVEHRPQTEDVRAMVDAKAARLFGRHVPDGPHHRRSRLAVDRDRLGGARQVPAKEFCEAEVENLDPAVRRDEQVFGFDVPMHDAVFVAGRETTGDLDGIVSGLAGRQRPPAHPFPERLAFEEFGDDVRPRALDADVMHGQDVRMIQAAGGSRFLLEPAAPIRIRRERRREDFECDVALQLMIAGPVHFTHAPGAERAENLEAAKAIADGERHGWRARLWAAGCRAEFIPRVCCARCNASRPRSLAARATPPAA